MTEFLNCKVQLNLKDGNSSTGTITNVDGQHIVLSNVSQSFEQGQIIPSLSYNNNFITDLKVLQLPPGYIKETNGKKKSKNKQIDDDAILFVNKSNSPKPSIVKHKNTKLKNITSTISNNTDWGSENEPTDIKGLSDFDFQANLAMFDKKSVFADFQKKDHTPSSDRLVGHNKVENVQRSKPKKEKYEHNEMVLEKSQNNDNWDNIGTSILSSLTKSSTPTLSRQPTGIEQLQSQNFKLVDSNHSSTIQLASPVQLLEIERLANDSFGVSSSVIAEVCATNLSQLIMDNILGGSTRLSNKNNHNLPPLVLLLVGSGRCGSRALVTGRHLTNHGIRVLAFVISSEDEDVKEQLKIFELNGGKTIYSDFSNLLNTINHELDTPVELIIDALQGYDDHLEDIFYQEDDIKSLSQLMHWCNQPQQQAKILSLDIPSGIDGGSGTLSDYSMKLNCRWCVSMAVPLSGLILAYKNGNLQFKDGQTNDIIHYVIDIGIPNKVYTQKGNLRKFDKFWFSSESILKLEVSTQ